MKSGSRALSETGDAGRLPPLRSPVRCGRAVPDTRAGAGRESPMLVAAANPQLLGTEKTFLPVTFRLWIAGSLCRQAQRSGRRRADARMEDPDAVEEPTRPGRLEGGAVAAVQRESPHDPLIDQKGQLYPKTLVRPRAYRRGDSGSSSWCGWFSRWSRSRVCPSRDTPVGAGSLGSAG